MRSTSLLLLALLLPAGCIGKGNSTAEKLGLKEPIIRFEDVRRNLETPTRTASGGAATRLQLRVYIRLFNPNDATIHIETMRGVLRIGQTQLPLDPSSRLIDLDVEAGASVLLPIDFNAVVRRGTIILFPLSLTGRMFFRDSKDRTFSISFVRQLEGGDQEEEPGTTGPSEENDPDQFG